jgi:predicted TIM-barrel fold metal-dependent hydrolase
MHAMNLNHPNFVALVESITNGFSEFVTSGALSPGYLLTPNNRGQQGLVTILNMFSVFERPIGEIFALMEDDLAGMFSHSSLESKNKQPANHMYPEQPYIRGGKFHFRDQVFDKIALIPLVMDFSRDQGEWGKSYYTCEQQEKVLSYVKDTLDGIDWYRKIRPKGLLEFFPFLGINPEAHSLDFIQEILSIYVRTDRSTAWNPRIAKPLQRFRGIKLYPPLGTDPWPSEPEKLEKITSIYRFCELHKLPIITHCDDQGFRGVNSKLAQQYTSPASWIPVFENFPDLKIDFAHYGKQYNIVLKPSLRALLENSFTSDPWFSELMELMRRFKHVYADFSFSGTDPRFYEQLHHFMDTCEDPALVETIATHSMFGSDFSVNLAKVESYSNYYRIFETSPFSSSQIQRFASENPIRFLGLDT